MRILTCILFIAVILLGITFATLNSATVNINYYIGHVTMALSLLLALAFAMGALLGILVGLWLLLKTKLKNYHLRQSLKDAQREIDSLRANQLQENVPRY